MTCCIRHKTYRFHEQILAASQSFSYVFWIFATPIKLLSLSWFQFFRSLNGMRWNYFGDMFKSFNCLSDVYQNIKGCKRN